VSKKADTVSNSVSTFTPEQPERALRAVSRTAQAFWEKYGVTVILIVDNTFMRQVI